MSISPPPYRDKDLTGQAWQKWFSSIFAALKTTAVSLTSWSSIDKSGSSLRDIETRNHDDLQNLNTNTHVHLTSSQYTGLTGGGLTNLHGHDFSANSMVIPGQDGEDGQDAMIIPGPQGIAGRDGLSIIGQDGEDGQDGMPGPQGIQGQQGNTGATGAIGPQGPIGLGIDGIDGEDGMFVVGPQGPQGIAGTNGATGPQGPAGLGLDGEDGESGYVVFTQPAFNRRLTLSHIAYRM